MPGDLPMMPTVKRECSSRVALHEAGHAIAALHFGLQLHYATIRPCNFSEILGAAGCVDVVTSAAAGHVWVKWPSPAVDWEPALVMTLAGPAAERRQFGDAQYGAGDVTRVRELVALLDLFDLQRCCKPTEADNRRRHAAVPRQSEPSRCRQLGVDSADCRRIRPACWTARR
jgi:hypothetical protein